MPPPLLSKYLMMSVEEMGVLEKCHAADISADGAQWIIKQTVWTKTYFVW